MSFIVFKNVSYTYPKNYKFALENISLSVLENEFLAVMGNNGSGKTTLCKLINGIIPHYAGGSLSGTVTVDGLKTNDFSVSQLSLKVGMVLDDPDAQLFTPTVRHEAAFGPENLLLTPDEINERIKFALCAVGLDGYENRVPSTLSGGEKQRLAIAAALSMKGKILVLDEPLCRLDPNGAQELMSILNEIKTKYQITIIMAAHESNIVAEYADRVCILKNGHIRALDTAENIFADNSLLEENGIQPVVKRFSHECKKEQELSAISFSFSSVPQTSESMYPHLDNSADSIIEIKNLCFSYPNGIKIENINLSINENDFIGIIGKNGCGKTTLLKNITGLLKPDSGDIFIRGRNTRNLKIYDISKEAGFVMQNPDTQLFTDSVYNEAAFALKKMKLSGKEINKRVCEALKTTGLDDADAYPHALSRSDRTKTVIACVLAMGCKIIIFDEADAGNDFAGKIRIMDIMCDLHSKGYTVIFVTHNMFLVHEYAHRLIKLERNGIVFDRRIK